MGPFARFPRAAVIHSANDGLMHLIRAAFWLAVAGIKEGKCDVRFGPRGLQALNGELAADVAFDEGGLVAVFLFAPGVDAECSEIARLTFRAVRAEKQILGHGLAGLRRYAIQFGP